MKTEVGVKRLLQGNEACAEGAVLAGCRFFAGYPITPSSEIAEYLSMRLPQVGGRFIQMEDEIASMAAIIGASLAGVKSMTATSGPGFSLKQENIGFACLTEVPCVIVNVQRGGPSSGLPTSPSQADIMQTRWGTHGDHPMMALCPSSVEETLHLTVECFNLSERFRNPVVLLVDEIVGHMREAIRIPEQGEVEVVDRVRPTCPPEEYLPYDNSGPDVNPMAPFGEGYRYHVTGLMHDETGFPTANPEVISACLERIHRKIASKADEIIRWEEFMLEDAEVAIFSFGATARSAKAAVRLARAEGIRAGLFRAITIWPFPERALSVLAQRVRHLLVAEMNLGQAVLEVERSVRRTSAEVSGVFKANGEAITPEEILARVREVA